LYAHSCGAAKNYVYSKKGATELVLDYIKVNNLLKKK